MPADRALMFDFDGTLYVGDLPVLAFARHCASMLPSRRATELIDGVRFFLEGKSVGGVQVDLGAAEDGDDAVEILAAALGLTAGQVSTAYRSARADLAGSAFALDAPEGLPGVLDELFDTIVIVVSNAERVGVEEVLRAIGLADHVDELITDADKPRTMPALIDATLRRIGALERPDHLMVVGDRWISDLADAAQAGAVTAMVDRFGRADGQPTVRSTDMAGLVPYIRSWAQERTKSHDDA